ncbi:MAG: Rrf2 family transcriptional regulator [Acidobacteriia bacterium]|nr:Rrf2 family transcriptional regulator [Terriglobia bacterium]
MLFQHASEIAIRATIFLAQQSPGKLSPVREVAARAGVPEAYLAKIFQRLSRAGLVRSFRGPGKGVELGHAPRAITLAALVRAAEGPAISEGCVFGLASCPIDTPCPLHRDWAPLQASIRELMENTTLADLIAVAPVGSGKPGRAAHKKSRSSSKREITPRGRRL